MNSLLIFGLATTFALTACGDFKTGSLNGAAAEIAEASRPDFNLSSMVVSSPRVADDATPVNVTVTFKSTNGKAIPGLSPNLSLTGEGKRITPCTVSDAGGVSKCVAYSSISGQSTLTTRTVSYAKEVVFSLDISFDSVEHGLTGFGRTSGGGVSVSSDHSVSVMGAIGTMESGSTLKSSGSTVQLRATHIQ